ncbi:putative exporter, TauE/SafE family (fragment) [Methylorubrum extorquens]|uniref:Putative exporter, TauE/SafE family n=1 Tax=Methylorubrum extorquens TaxID=408 RepID=A0A2N9AWC2_METEX
MSGLLTSGLATGPGGVVGAILGLVGGGQLDPRDPRLIYVVGVNSPHVAIGTSDLAASVSAAGNLVSQ